MGGWMFGLLVVFVIFVIFLFIVVWNFDIVLFLLLVFGGIFVFVGCLSGCLVIGDFCWYFLIVLILVGLIVFIVGLWYLFFCVMDGMDGGEIGVGVFGLIVLFVFVGIGMFVNCIICD